MSVLIHFWIILNLGFTSTGKDLYSNYVVIYNPLKSLEWSDDRALAYITTVRIFDYNHHIFQYRRFPCQYFYTDEIQMYYNNETRNECIYNTKTSSYQYNFQLHLDSRHVEPYILRNIAIQCKYMNCSLSLLKMKYLSIEWNAHGRDHNPDCSFDNTTHYGINSMPYTVSEWITLNCQSLSACHHSKSNLETALLTNIQIIYGSSYDLQSPYCSLEKNLAYIIEKNFEITNRLLEQLVETIQRGFGKPNEREQNQMKEYVAQKIPHHETNITLNTTGFSGEIHGTFHNK